MVKLLLSDKCLTVLVFHNKDFMTVAAICLFHIITSKLQDLYFCDEQRYVYRKSLFTAGELVAGSIMQDHPSQHEEIGGLSVGSFSHLSES